jgi:hypothetical protein
VRGVGGVSHAIARFGNRRSGSNVRRRLVHDSTGG